MDDMEGCCCVVVIVVFLLISMFLLGLAGITAPLIGHYVGIAFDWFFKYVNLFLYGE
jgi:hypothetical protein